MKTICTLKKGIPVLVIMFASITMNDAYAQPDYSFTGGTLISGTNLAVGAVYKYTNVKTGVDAIVSITAMSPGIGLTELDGTSGYPATIQPTITANAWTTGYVELTVTFKTAGTNTDMVQPEIAVTAFDVDGVTNYDGAGHNLYEYDQINLGSAASYANFNTVNSELSISQSGNWWTGTNISGIDYPGRDTSAQQVMFSVIKTNVTTAIIRVGVNNQTANAASRLRAIYFKKFLYKNPLLAIGDVHRLRRENDANSRNSFKMYPTNLQGSTIIAIESAADGKALFQLVDYSGRVLQQQQINVEKGANRIPFNNISNLNGGNYVAVLKLNGVVYNQKVIRN